tara:strand:- start:44 stop:763 length:720 start_codon:yes stop_codon:yes gene_type:complete
MIGFIYKLYCLDDNIKDCYIGSTWNILDRMRQHKNTCNSINSQSYNYNLYKFIRANGGWSNWLYEFYDIDVYDIYQLEQIEQTQMDIEIFPLLNAMKASTGLTRKEYSKQYKIDNKESIKEYRKKHYFDNKETLSKAQDCPCGGTYTPTHKARHFKSIMHKEYINLKEYNQKYYKEYGKTKYIANKQHYIESATKSYIKNKEHLNKKINCKCGGKYTYKNKKRHLESIKHRGYEIIIQA